MCAVGSRSICCERENTRATITKTTMNNEESLLAGQWHCCSLIYRMAERTDDANVAFMIESLIGDGNSRANTGCLEHLHHFLLVPNGSKCGNIWHIRFIQMTLSIE